MLAFYRRKSLIVAKLQRAWTIVRRVVERSSCGSDNWPLVEHWLHNTRRYLGSKPLRQSGLCRLGAGRCNTTTILAAIDHLLDTAQWHLSVLDYLWTIAPPGGEGFRTFDVRRLVRFAQRQCAPSIFAQLAAPITHAVVEQIIDRFHLHQLVLLEIEHNDKIVM